jgi:hypothetical protein
VKQVYPGTFIRGVRVVPVAGPAPDAPVDLRISGGVVTEVAPGLVPRLDEEVHEAADRWAMPGLWDAHVHLTQWGLAATRLDLSGTGGPDEVLALVRDHLARIGPGPSVVQGWGHRTAPWARQPRVAELDAVTGSRPVVLISGDGHHGWLNSAALAALGIPLRDGILEELDWFPAWSRLAELPGAAEAAEAGVVGVVRRAAARGVVGIVDMELAANHRAWPDRFAAGVRSLRVRAATYADGLADVIAAGLATGDALTGGAGLLTMGPLKVISDGSLNTRTAHCCEPYSEGAELEHPYGVQNTGLDELVALFVEATAARIEVAVHAIGDCAVRTALDAVERAGAHGSIEHAQLVADSDVARMAALGLVASVQPAHVWDDRDVTDQCWPDRAGRAYAFRSMLDAGVRLALGSDAPVSPLDPWLAIAAAVHRSADDREPWHPEQAITVLEALAASTDGQRTLGAGSRGDIVLLDADPLAGPGDDTAALAAHLRGMPVAATFVGGRPTHLAL